jgi:hypothetical protein
LRKRKEEEKKNEKVMKTKETKQVYKIQNPGKRS